MSQDQPQNTTAYAHPRDPNLNRIENAMEYNDAGEPVLRVLTYSSGGTMDLTALSVSTVAASGGGTLAYDNNTGVFTYAPANLSGYATTTYVTNQINAVKDRIVSPNDQHTAVIDNTGTTTFGGDILPGAATYNLGSIANPWKDVYVSKGSIIIADTDVNVDGVAISNTSKYIVIDRGGLKVTSSIPGREIFQLDNTGKLLIKSEIPAANDSAAFEVIGSLLGESLPIVNRGVMIHSSGAVNIPSRIYIDGVGTQATAPYDSAYAAFIGRYARNTVADPAPAQAGDLIVRFGGNAYASTIGLNSISNVRIDMTATETQSAEGRGSRIELWTTAIGSIVPQRSLHVDSGGIDLSEATDTNAGVTFKDGSLLKYWPSVDNNAGKILRTDGTTFFWGSETVPNGITIFKGDWSAANPPAGGTPTISDITGQAGWQWIVSAPGIQDLGSGNISFAVGDLVIHNGTNYVRIQATTPQIQADWTETNTALPAYIKHKPNLATIATTGSWNDLGDKPYIPPIQVNADWDATSGLSQILHKPSIPTQYTDALAQAAISLTSNTPTGTTSTLTYTGGVFTFTSAAALVSGTTIKTVNGNSLLGSGNVSVGTVTSVSGTGTVSGITLGGTVTGSGSLSLTGTLSGITNSNLSGTAGITNANLANSTISGVSLGGSLYNLTAGTNVTFSTGSTYNGSQAITINVATGAGYTLPAATTTTLGGVIVPAVATSGITNTSGTIGLAIATASQLGGVKQGSNVTIDAGGVISVAAPYSLPVATTSVLGGVKQGSNVTIGVDGAISVAAPYTLPTASTTVLGGVKVDGTTVTISSGVISAVNNNGVGGNQLVYALNGSLNLTSAKNTLVSMFGLTSGVALQSNTRYHYELVFTLSSNKAGALSYALALNGGAVVAQHNFQWMGNKTATIDGYGAGIAMASFNATGAAITTAKDVAAFDNFTHVVIYGNIDVTSAGSINFMLSQDQNTPITWTMLPGAYVKLLPLGAISANTVAGTWA